MDDPAIEATRAKLLAAIRRGCPRWLASRADDLAQVAILRILDRAGASGGIGSLHPSYLKKVAYSVIVDEMRRGFHRNEAPEDPEGGIDATPSNAGSPEAAVASRRLYRAILGCLGSLADARRAAVACHLQGYSVPESAALLGWTLKKTEHLSRRGMDDLRECLTSKGIES